MVEGKRGDPKAIRLELSVPCDARFRHVLAALSEKMAAYVGYAAPEATQVADTVVHATDGVFGDDEPTAYTTLDVTFATSDQEMEIRVRYVCAETDASRTGTPEIERLLSRRQGGAAPIDAMQRVMGRVEFGHTDGVEFCTLTKRLPNAD